MRTNIARSTHRAFTLIEILIVVVILGILAAIVIPQFTDATQAATDSSVRSQLQTIRSTIELYRAQERPLTTAVWHSANSTAPSDWLLMIDGDYLQTLPKNPLWPAGSAQTAISADGSGAWRWAAKNASATVPSYTMFANNGDGSLFDEN